MDKRNQLIIAVGLLCSLILVPVVVALLNQHATPSNISSEALTTTPAERTSSDITTAIKKADSSLRDSGNKPTFSLLGFKRLAGNWYVAWIDTKTTKVLINDPSVSPVYMSSLLGPDTVFSETDAISKGIPTGIFKDFKDATL